jgi:hypothetical protein
MLKLQLSVRDGNASELWKILQENISSDADFTVTRPDGQPPPGTFGLTGTEITVDVATLAAIAKLARFLYDWLSPRTKTTVEVHDKTSGLTVILSRNMTEEEALHACSTLYAAAQRARGDDSRSLPSP